MKKTKIILLAITFSAISGMANLANAQCAIDQSQPLHDNGLSARNLPGYYEGQTFTAGATGSLCEIDLLMFNTMTGTGTLNIYSGSGIGGTLLATQSVNVIVPSMTDVWQNWIISSPPTVTSGSVYTFQFIPTQGGGLPDPYGIDLQFVSDEYSGGHCLSFPTGDLCFRTYVDITTDLNDIHPENSFEVYPNPSNGKFTIICNRNINKIEIYDYLGESVITTVVNPQTPTEIDLSDYPKGIYFVVINDGSKSYSEKIVIQ